MHDSWDVFWCASFPVPPALLLNFHEALQILASERGLLARGV